MTSLCVGTWYRALPKPSFNPPHWVFGPVWTVLYGLMAVAASRAQLPSGGTALVAPARAQSALVGLGEVGLALVEISMLPAAITAAMLAFRRVDTLAAALMLPYLLWTCFAAILDAAIWTLAGSGHRVS